MLDPVWVIRRPFYHFSSISWEIETSRGTHQTYMTRNETVVATVHAPGLRLARDFILVAPFVPTRNREMGHDMESASTPEDRAKFLRRNFSRDRWASVCSAR